MKKSFLNRINSVRARRMVSLVLALAFCLSFGGWFVIEGDDAPAVPVCGITEHVHDLSCRETVCGVPETPAHTHGPECYESVLICTDESPEHVHGDGCYQSVLTCALPEGEGHIHDESCYKKVLICEDVSPEHIHDELCYEYSYICGMEEHVHTDECYVLQDETQQDDQDSQDGEIVDGQPLPDVPVQNDPAAVTYCGMIEHTHTPECYDITGALICGMPEHQHYDTCYIDPTAMTYCGMVEHTHTPECYDIAGALVCGLEQHTHTVDCYVRTVYYCGKEEHSHTPTCYNELNELICGLEEHWHTPECLQPIVYYCGKEEHQHTDACYSVEGILTCLIEEHTHSAECLMPPAPVYYCGKEEHQHTDACYSVEGILTCLIEEHTHSAECQLPPAPVYYCGKEEHVHTDACYSIEGILTCTIEEHLHTVECEIMPEPQADVIETYCGLTEHTHTDDCYAWNCDLQLTDPTHVHSTATCAYSLICMLPEHVHDWKCYISPDAPIICGKEEHTHSDACGYWSCTELMAHEHRPEYGCTWVPVCLKEEHTHGPECYGAPGSAGYGCGLEEHTHGPECYETVYLCGNTDPAHVHDETCPSELRLICTKPEHIHDFMCEVMGDTVAKNELEENVIYVVNANGEFVKVNYDQSNPLSLVVGEEIKVAAKLNGASFTIYGNDPTINGEQKNGYYLESSTEPPENGITYRTIKALKSYDGNELRIVIYAGDWGTEAVSSLYIKIKESEKNKLYILTDNGNLKGIDAATNELTGNTGRNGDIYEWGGDTDNQYPLTIGSTLKLVLDYTDANVKDFYISNHSGNNGLQIESQSKDTFNQRVTCTLKATTVGEYRANIDTNGSDNEGGIEFISIKVVEPDDVYADITEYDIIYYKDRTGKYIKSKGDTEITYTVYPGEVIDLVTWTTKSIEDIKSTDCNYWLDSNATEEGYNQNLCNITIYSEIVGNKNKYIKGQIKISEDVETNGKFIVTLTNGRNSTSTVNYPKIIFEVFPHKISVDNIVVGTKEYGKVSIDAATRMAQGTVDKDGYTVYNSEETPYILYVGQSIDISAEYQGTGYAIYVDGVNGEGDYKILSRGKYNDVADTKHINAGYVGHYPGKVCVVVKNGENIVDRFWIEVHRPIYIETAIGPIHKNRVHEYLELLHSEPLRHNENKSKFVFDPEGYPLYLKNLPEQINGDTNFRYVAFDGDTIEITTCVSNGTLPDNVFTFVSNNSEVKIELVTGGYEQEYENYEKDCAADSSFKQVGLSYSEDKTFKIVSVEEPLIDDFYNQLNLKKVSAKFKLTKTGAGETGKSQINVPTPEGHRTETDYYESLYLEVGGKTSNHFDIELVDGGTYTVVKTITDANNKKYRIKTVYNAMVTGVNECNVYMEKEASYDGREVSRVYTLGPEDYWLNKTDGTQLELTSAYWTDGTYLLEYSGVENKYVQKLENGVPVNAGAAVRYRNIPRADIDHVDFDVSITLEPKGYVEVTEIVDNSGNEIEMSKHTLYFEDGVAKDEKGETYTQYNDLKPKSAVMPSVNFEMGEREIIDAYNKCPNSSGLDFTIRAEMFAAAVQPEAVKKYVGWQDGDPVMEDGEIQSTFSFSIYDEFPFKKNDLGNLPRPIETVKNLNESVKFVHYFTSEDSGIKPGKTNYIYIVENQDKPISGVTYDSTIYRMVVEVREFSTGELSAQIKGYQRLKADVNYATTDIEDDKYWKSLEEGQTPTFINHAPFELPVTGGGGAGSPRAVGAGLIITGFILMPKGRRRERSGCLRDAARAGDKK